MRTFAVPLLITGTIFLLLGIGFLIADKFNLSFFGRLPGDIYYKGENTTFIFPITTCIILSILLSVILNIISRFIKM